MALKQFKNWFISLTLIINNMKSILAVLLSFLSLGVFAQSTPAKPAVSKNCFNEWYALFKERGAKPIPTGIHDVIIAVRKGDYSECFMGKIDVLDGKITGRPQVQKVDGSYEEWDYRISQSYFDSEGKIKSSAALEINNGMSAEITLADGENVRLFFYKFVADKAKQNKKAPAPSSLVKN
jgi:hypothetical protein